MARVLIVDDDLAIREMLTALIEQETQHETLAADNGREALRALREQQPVDVVVCDINMPVMSGYDLVRAIRADAQLARTPVIITSAGVFLERVAPELDVDVLLEKPFEIGALLACLSYVLNGARKGGRKVRVTRRRAMSTLNHMLRPAQRLSHSAAR
jgi:chemosensory pili system protein ChpA (sensor histidine kinase/response regulator)